MKLLEFQYHFRNYAKKYVIAINQKKYQIGLKDQLEKCSQDISVSIVDLGLNYVISVQIHW
jgi:hypothetical protein